MSALVTPVPPKRFRNGMRRVATVPCGWGLLPTCRVEPLEAQDLEGCVGIVGHLQGAVYTRARVNVVAIVAVVVIG